MRLALIDYGMGNVRSVFNTFEQLKVSIECTADPAAILSADGIVLPGVGAFGDGMKALEERGLLAVLNEAVIEQRKPYLGICLGMQFLAEEGFEEGKHAGFGWIKGAARRLSGSPECKVPHMGWNDVEVLKAGGLFTGLENPVFYFVHSYYLDPQESERQFITALCRHGQPFAAALQKESIFGVQFHPEKSQQAGLQVLENFIAYIQLNGAAAAMAGKVN